jgi:CheY-like chemotaxis protein
VRVLVVDDNLDGLELTRAMLEQAGAGVTAVASVPEALDVLGRAPVDVLVSDLGMPGADGYDLIRLLRERPRERGGAIPAIALTAHASGKERARALEDRSTGQRRRRRPAASARPAASKASEPGAGTSVVAKVALMLETRALPLRPLSKAKARKAWAPVTPREIEVGGRGARRDERHRVAHLAAEVEPPQHEPGARQSAVEGEGDAGEAAARRRRLHVEAHAQLFLSGRLGEVAGEAETVLVAGPGRDVDGGGLEVADEVAAHEGAEPEVPGGHGAAAEDEVGQGDRGRVRGRGGEEQDRRQGSPEHARVLLAASARPTARLPCASAAADLSGAPDSGARERSRH